MGDNLQNSKRIAKNTLMLYIRMLLIMVVTLYTSRVILHALGVEDYGLYNVVGGVVVLFTFINNAMVSSTQRFLNFELGRNNFDGAQKVFSASLNIHILIAIIFLILSETIGLWLLNRYIKIPVGREVAANWVYQFSIIVSIINIIRSPYNAAIIAHENMSFYAYLSIIEIVLRLAIVYLVYLFIDRLIAYAFLLMVVAVIILCAYYIFCKKKYTVCKYCFNYDKKLYLQLAGFSGWSLFGSFANMGATQGINIILNTFFGVTVNAAMGIANQVNTAVYTFVSNFQIAFNPQIVKSYANGDRDYFISLIMNTSRYSFLLLFLLSLPIYICCPEILSIWLKTVPDYAVEFCRLMLVYLLIDSIQGPLWVSVQATGKIRNYQIMMSLLILMNLPITYVLLVFFRIPEIALLVRIAINFVTAMARVIYLNHLYGFPVRRYLSESVCKCMLVLIISFPLPYIMHRITSVTFTNTILNLIVAFMCAIIAITFIGLNLKERVLVINKTKQLAHKLCGC